MEAMQYKSKMHIRGRICWLNAYIVDQQVRATLHCVPCQSGPLSYCCEQITWQFQLVKQTSASCNITGYYLCPQFVALLTRQHCLPLAFRQQWSQYQLDQQALVGLA